MGTMTAVLGALMALSGWAVAVLVRRDRRRAPGPGGPGDAGAGRRSLREARADARTCSDLGPGAVGLRRDRDGRP